MNALTNFPCKENVTIWLVDKYGKLFNIDKNATLTALNISAVHTTYDPSSNLYTIYDEKYHNHINILVAISLSMIDKLCSVDKQYIYKDLNVSYCANGINLGLNKTNTNTKIKRKKQNIKMTEKKKRKTCSCASLFDAFSVR